MHRERSESRNEYKGNIDRHRRVHTYMGVDEDMVIEMSEQNGISKSTKSHGFVYVLCDGCMCERWNTSSV